MEEEKIKKSYTWKKWIFYFSLFLVAIILYKILDNFTGIKDWIKNLFKILSPFVGGILIAYILYLPCKKIENTYKTTPKTRFVNKHARTMSILTVYIMAIIIIMILSNCLIPIVIQSLEDLINNVPNYYNVAKNTVNSLPNDNPLISNTINNAIDQISKIDFKSYISPEKILQYVQGIMSAVSNIFNIFISIVVSVYILSQRKKIVKDFGRFNRAILNEQSYNKLSRYFRNGNEIFFKFLTSQIIDAFIVGALVSVAMLILKVKYAILLGFFIGLFNLIPFFGAIIAIIIAIIITILTGGIGKAILMAVVIIILQQIDANIINPKIVGSSLNISQILVIFAVTIGGAYFGVLGMFLAVPVITVIRMMIKDYVIEKENQKNVKID